MIFKKYFTERIFNGTFRVLWVMTVNSCSAFRVIERSQERSGKLSFFKKRSEKIPPIMSQETNVQHDGETNRLNALLDDLLENLEQQRKANDIWQRQRRAQEQLLSDIVQHLESQGLRTKQSNNSSDVQNGIENPSSPPDTLPSDNNYNAESATSCAMEKLCNGKGEPEATLGYEYAQVGGRSVLVLTRKDLCSSECKYHDEDDAKKDAEIRENIADDVTYSGTIAGAIEGTLLGVKSIALSQAYNFEDGVRHG